MKKSLGISIYPSQKTLADDLVYIEKAGKLGFTRIFSCMISSGDDVDETVRIFKIICECANKNGLEVIIDVAQVVFERFNIKYDDLSFFKNLGAAGIRLDEGLDAQKVAAMTYNKEGLKIEMNASQLCGFAEDILSFKAKRDCLISCHNFYPQKYSGISLKYFDRCNDALKKLNMKIAAFVSSQNNCQIAPWAVNEGLCTLEQHRNFSVSLQARHLFATDCIDEVIIGNAYASDAELKELSSLEKDKLTFKMTKEVELSDVESQIVYDFPHYVRGDMSEYAARSTFSRITYKDAEIKPKNTRDLKVGDIVVLNDNYGRYKGELHIITKAMPNEGNKNVVGTLSNDEQVLLNYIDSWKPFKII